MSPAQVEEKGMSGMKKIVMGALAALFLGTIIAGCVQSKNAQKYDTKWDVNKKEYVKTK